MGFGQSSPILGKCNTFLSSPKGINHALLFNCCGLDSSVGAVTDYGLDGPGIESRWGRDIPHLSRPVLGPTQPPVQRVPGLSQGKERPGRDADPSLLLVPWPRKGRAVPLIPLWAIQPVQGCTLPYSLYRASVPVQGCTLPYCLYRASVPAQGGAVS
jgi:hypothetical protein